MNEHFPRVGPWLLAASVLLPACTHKDEKSTAADPDDAAPVIYTTFYPTTYMAERIGGDVVRVVCPCPQDADPSEWMPDEKTIGAYQSADLIVINGASFEKWVDKASLPAARVVDTAKPLADSLITLKDAVKHSHGPGGEHSHEGIDGHTWLDPMNAKIQAEQIMRAMIERWPEDKAAFEAGYASLEKDLDALDLRLREISKQLEERRVLASHPAYNYVARRYGWRQEYFLLEPTEAPHGDTAKALLDSVQKGPAHLMLWESLPTPSVAQWIEQNLEVKNVLFSPCESRPLAAAASDGGRPAEDYLAVMKANLDRLDAALGP